MFGNSRLFALSAGLALGACALDPVVHKGTISVDGKSYPFEDVYQPASYGPGGTSQYYVTVSGVRISCSPAQPLCEAEVRQFLQDLRTQNSVQITTEDQNPPSYPGGFENGD